VGKLLGGRGIRTPAFHFKLIGDISRIRYNNLGHVCCFKGQEGASTTTFHLALSSNPKVWWLYGAPQLKLVAQGTNMQLCPNKNMYKKKDKTLFFIIKFTHIATSILLQSFQSSKSLTLEHLELYQTFFTKVCIIFNF
jgi:hypothetical protein